MLIVQGPNIPGTMLTGLLDQVGSDLVSIRFAVAYATSGGMFEVVNRIEEKLGPSWHDVQKSLVVSLDFGLTDPKTIIEFAAFANSEVRVANPASLTPPYMPKGSAFHPKIYLFDYATHSRLLIGSANLTQRAFTTNAEGAAVDVLEGGQADALWQALWVDAVPVGDVDLDTYAAWRKESKPPIPPDAPPTPPPTQPESLQTLADGITSGFDPAMYEHMWVQAGSMTSGGSHNQLELPRGGNRFFGFDFSDYSSEHSVIGFPIITTRLHNWDDRKLTWHGNNMMERMNLPTLAQGGFNYVETAVMFRRMPDGTFELYVDAWNDPLAVSWRSASELLGTVFRLGDRSDRTVGFF